MRHNIGIDIGSTASKVVVMNEEGSSTGQTDDSQWLEHAGD